MAKRIVLHPNIKNIKDQGFGQLTVIKYAGKTKDRHALWLCLCACGRKTTVAGTSLRSGNTETCGCGKSKFKATHGLSDSREFRCWHQMIQRCTNPNNNNWYNYGGRGITICAEWQKSFAAFFTYVGPSPSALHSLDRFPDWNGNYKPGNVRWATQKEQMRNTRRNVRLTHNGKTMLRADWAEQTGLHEQTIAYRMKIGLTVADALTRPQQPGMSLVRDESELVTFNGETLRIAEWAKRTRIDGGTLRSRLTTGWTMHDALTIPSGQKNAELMLTFSGQTLPMSTWSARLKLSRNCVRMRLTSGWSVEEALTTPKRQKRSH